MSNKKAVQWAKDNEEAAIESFEALIGERLVRSGVWINESGVLCASPVGFYGEYVVEIKCYFKSRESLLTKSSVSTDLSYVISYNKFSNVWVVNENHEIFHQIQGYMHLTNKDRCYFFLWTPKEKAVVEIEKEARWSENIVKMENFYFNNFITFLLNS